MDLWGWSYLALWLLVALEGVALLVLAHAVGSIYLSSRQAIERDGLPIGSAAPSFEASDVAGKAVTLADLLGSWLVLLFATPACQVCRRMLPELGEFAETVRGSANVVLAVRGSIDEAGLLAAGLPSSVQVLAIGAHGPSEKYRVRVSPYVNIVDATGMIRAKGLVNNAVQVSHLLFTAGLHDETDSGHTTELEVVRGEP